MSAGARTAADLPQAILAAATPAAWVNDALAHWPEVLLDHANCEKKAASTALALMFAYPEDRALSVALARVAREELRHFEQVAAALTAAGVPFKRQRPGRYAQQLRATLRTSRPGPQARSAARGRAHRGALGGALWPARPAPAGAARAAVRRFGGVRGAALPVVCRFCARRRSRAVAGAPGRARRVRSAAGDNRRGGAAFSFRATAAPRRTATVAYNLAPGARRICGTNGGSQWSVAR